MVAGAVATEVAAAAAGAGVGVEGAGGNVVGATLRRLPHGRRRLSTSRSTVVTPRVTRQIVHRRCCWCRGRGCVCWRQCMVEHHSEVHIVGPTCLYRYLHDSIDSFDASSRTTQVNLSRPTAQWKSPHSSSLHVQAENGAKKSQTTIHQNAMISSRCGRRCLLVLNTSSYSPFAVTTRHALMLRENVTLCRHSHAGWWGDSAGVLQPRHR